jgi:LysR family transcriptional regulator, glycine cleavage system transcriptional activator
VSDLAAGCDGDPAQQQDVIAHPHLQLRENVKRPEDLLRLTLFYDETDDAWAEWFDAVGLDGTRLPPGPTYPNCELSTTMVEQGQGVSLAYDAVVRGTLASGRLERLFEIVTLPMAIYSVACQVARAEEPRIAAFRRWLRAEAEAEGVLPEHRQLAAE